MGPASKAAEEEGRVPAEPPDTDPDVHVSPRHPETKHPLRAGAPLWLRTEQSVAGEARALGLAAWAPGRISKLVSTTVPGAHRGTHSSGAREEPLLWRGDT